MIERLGLYLLALLLLMPPAIFGVLQWVFFFESRYGGYWQWAHGGSSSGSW